jgi:hypothetical protein
VGAGLISTWKADTNHRMWIGSQILFGFGGGLGAQQAMIAVQTVLPLKDVPFGIAIINFAQTIGGACKETPLTLLQRKRKATLTAQSFHIRRTKRLFEFSDLQPKNK